MTSLDKTPGIGAPRQAPPPQQLDLLRDEIKAFDEKKRLDAVRKLGALHDKRAVPDLIGRLHIDGSPEVRKAAIEALYAINDAQGWPDIAIVLKQDESAEVRSKAADVLGLSGDQKMAEALVDALKDGDSDVRKRAAIGIGKLQNTSVVPRLIAGLSQVDGARNEEFEADHVEALVQLSGWTVVEGIVGSANTCKDAAGGYGPNTDTGIYELQYRTSTGYSSYTLARFYESRITVLKRLQMVRFNYSDAAPVLVLVSRSIAFLKDPKSAEMLCEIASKSREPAVRWLALSSLQARKATSTGDTLQRVLKEDADWIVRKKAAEVLGELRISAADDLLCHKALGDSERAVRHQAIHSLGQLAVVSAIPTLSEVVQRSPDDQARTLAVGALGQIKSEQAVNPLTSALGTDRNVDVQKTAASSLGTVGSKSALPYLTQVMKDEKRNAEVRLAAAGAAAKLGVNEAVDALCAVLSSSDFAIRITAVKLLTDINTERSTTCLAKVLATAPTPSGYSYYNYGSVGYQEDNITHLAVSALAKRRTASAISSLGGVVCATSVRFDSYVVQTAVDALIAMDPKQALEYFRKALWAGQNVDPVAQGVAKLGGTAQAGEVLLNVLKSTRDDDTKVACIFALRDMKYSPSYGHLQRLAGEKQYERRATRDAAQQALTGLKRQGEQLPLRSNPFGPFWTP